MRTLRRFLFLYLIAAVLFAGGCSSKREQIVVFSAAGMAPVLDAVKSNCRDNLGLEMLFEASGSEVACRKLNELGRACDVLIVADKELIARLTGSHCGFRIDFAGDEMVLGVGSRARFTDEAEKDWVKVLLKDEIRIARVDETLAPIGYRTLLVWELLDFARSPKFAEEHFDKRLDVSSPIHLNAPSSAEGLEEKRGNKDLRNRLQEKCKKVVDDVEKLMPLLKTGEIDYAFVYRSSCIAHDVRFIELAPEINLGSEMIDYSKASIDIEYKKSDVKEVRQVEGAPIVFSLSIPDTVRNRPRAEQFVNFLLGNCKDVIKEKGFTVVMPKFFGSRENYNGFAKVAQYKGELK